LDNVYLLITQWLVMSRLDNAASGCCLLNLDQNVGGHQAKLLSVRLSVCLILLCQIWCILELWLL